jgi:phosphatidate cytidylyltransferase
VIAEDPFEGDAAGYGSQPRWRDEGERTVETDFDDLRDDAPLLGALAGSQLPDPDEEIDFFDSEVDRDPLEAFADDAAFGGDADFGDESVTRRRTATRRRPRRTAERGGGEGDDDGSAGGGGSGGGDRNLVTAVIVGVALVLVGVACFILGGLATTVLACVIVGAAAYEFFGAVESRGFQPAALLGLVATIGLLVATYFSGLNAYPVVLTLTVVLGLLWYLWVTPGEHSVRNLGITLLGVMWIGFLGSFATLFLGLGKVLEDSHPKMTSNIGIGVLIAAVVATVAHDIGAYFVGQYAGKTPMSAASPNKTLEGLVGGVVCSIVATVVIVGFFSIHPIGGDIFRVFVFAVLCAVVAPLGDLCESFIKRDLGLKDMGSVLPGHGGVLDRFDALLFVLPTAYFATLLFNTWAG